MSSEGYMAKVNKQIPSAYVDAWKRDALHLGSNSCAPGIASVI